MVVDIKVPSPGESISEVEIANWLVSDGDYVEKDQVIAEIDSDKATLEVAAEEAGTVSIKVKSGTIAVGATLCNIDTSAKRPAGKIAEPKKEETKVETIKEVVSNPISTSTSSYANGHPSVSAKKLMDENGISADKIKGSGKGGRITKTDVFKALSTGFSTNTNGWGGSREVTTEKMSALRIKLSERLVTVKNTTAMLTTFNEVDMSSIMNLRNKYKEEFKEVHGVGLGYISFFTKAVTEALAHFPKVNSQISETNEIVNFNYADIGIAVSSPKGLMVPVIRNAEQMSLAQIEADVIRLAIKARTGKITLDDMTGGTFTITNGGVFGSMLSTPILNPPQSAILGMHNIVDRPVAINGKVEIRPIMYVALSYDHRIIDGKESVGFLVKVKEMLENPIELMFGSKDPEKVLLGL